METRSRSAPGLKNVSGPQRSVRSDIQVKPAETVEIRLPMLGDGAGPFAKRAFSIRSGHVSSADANNWTILRETKILRTNRSSDHT